MSRNGSGTYTLPAGNPVVTGTTITSSWANATLSNIADALTQSVSADGQTPITGDINMTGHLINNVTDPTSAQDAATKAYVDTATSGLSATYLTKANNLSDVASTSTSRTNLGLGTIATQAASSVAITGGAVDGTAIGTTTRSSVKATTLDLGLSTQSVAIGQGNASIMKNRIINGAMVIDQRNAGASVTPTTDGQYTLDRWGASISQTSKFSVQQNAGSVTPPIGFTNYLGATSLSAYSVLTNDYFLFQQKIEGYNVSDLGWGTANAKTVTLSFQVYSSLTGTFGGSLSNSAINRSYPFSYTVSSANTWEQKSITIAGDTSGTWLTTNGIGLRVILSLGAGSGQSGTAGSWAGAQYLSATGATSVVGTSGATFYITGVQLEVGSSATGFEYVNYQTSLANCQRYYYQVATGSYFGGLYNNTSNGMVVMKHAVTMRTNPTVNYTISGGGSLNGTYLYPDTSTIYIASNTPSLSTFNASAEL